MSDDNFFNKSINEAAGSGFAGSFDTTGVLNPIAPALSAGTSYINASSAPVSAVLPPASVGAGVAVTLAVADVTSAVSVAPDGTDTINGVAGLIPLAAIGVYTFVSDGDANWIHTV